MNLVKNGFAMPQIHIYLIARIMSDGNPGKTFLIRTASKLHRIGKFSESKIYSFYSFYPGRFQYAASYAFPLIFACAFYVNAAAMQAAGITFYLGNGKIWLCDYVSPEYLTIQQ